MGVIVIASRIDEFKLLSKTYLITEVKRSALRIYQDVSRLWEDVLIVI
jgi:hypothetical protein